MSEAIKEFIAKASVGPLTRKEAEKVFTLMMTGETTHSQSAGILMAMRTRGETVDEFSAAASVMRSHCIGVKAPSGAMDIVGTGGDGKGTLNISTATAILVAACGVHVAKHGNRNLSSKSGAADVLSELNINVMAGPEISEKAINRVGIGFLMAPLHHPAMKHVMPVRQELGTRTIFNILGPLTNPAEVKFQLTGAFSRDLLLPMAKTLGELGCKKAWIVHGQDGTDEISISGKTFVVELSDGNIREFAIEPADAGLPIHPFENILGGTPSFNADAIRELFSGKESPYRDAVLLNASAALIVANKVDQLPYGVTIARKALSDGLAQRKLEDLVAATN